MTPEESMKSVPAHERPETGANAPHKLTFIENVIGTIKVLALMALLGAAIWGVEFWQSTR